MSYNNGSFSLFNQAGFTISSAIYAESIIPNYQPRGSAKYVNIYGSSIQPTVSSSGISSVTNAYGLSLSLSVSASNMTLLNAYCLSVTSPTIASGTCSFLYGLYVTKPTASGSGTVSNPYTAFIQGMVGIGTSIPMNELDIGTSALNSGLAVGTYAGVVTVPPSSVLVSGAVGVGTPRPVYPLDVQGGAAAFEVLAAYTTVNRQESLLGSGFNQGGFGSGAVGSNFTLNSLSAQIFDLSKVNSQAGGFSGGAYDGRYVYFFPDIFSVLTRYDTKLPFNSTVSYECCPFPITGEISGLGNGQFDGRYIYVFSSIITQYDTTKPFSMSSSYKSITATSINSLAGFVGGGTDGNYVYFSLGYNSAPSGVLARYNPLLNFSSPSSYQCFDAAANLNSLCIGYVSAAFDGRYVYYAPFLVTIFGEGSGLILRYDTTFSFTSSSSYQFFDLYTIGFIQSFLTVIFDGKWIRWIIHDHFPNWVAYDPSMPFTNSLSYSFFDLNNLVNSQIDYAGGGFDGRYVYMVPCSINGTATYSGIVICYDTTLPLGETSSYQVLDATVVNSFCKGFRGFVSDGTYGYFVPCGIAATGPTNNPYFTILRIPVYTGPPTTTPIIGYSTGLTVSGNLYFQMPTTTTATAGTAGASPSMASGFLQVFVNGNLRYIPFY